MNDLSWFVCQSSQAPSIAVSERTILASRCTATGPSSGHNPPSLTPTQTTFAHDLSCDSTKLKHKLTYGDTGSPDHSYLCIKCDTL